MMSIQKTARCGDWEYLFAYLRDHGYIVVWIGGEPAFNEDHTQIVCPLVEGDAGGAKSSILGDRTGAIAFGRDFEAAEDYWTGMIDSLEIEEDMPSSDMLDTMRF